MDRGTDYHARRLLARWVPGGKLEGDAGGKESHPTIPKHRTAAPFLISREIFEPPAGG